MAVSRLWLLAPLGLALAALSLVGRAEAATLPPGFAVEPVISGLTLPTQVRFAPDGRVFVAERSGIVKVFDSSRDTAPEVFADLRTQVFNFGAAGLLGLAVDPGFPSRPYIYVLYGYDRMPGDPQVPRWGVPGMSDDACPTPPGPEIDGCAASGRLSRLTAVGNVAAAETVLIEDWCHQFTSHSIGEVEFGPDGLLYVSAGEGGSFTFADYGQAGGTQGAPPPVPANACGDPPTAIGVAQAVPTAEGGSLRSQDYRTMADPLGLSGTMIRVDPDTGAGAPGNPRAFHPDPNARRLIAFGLRNPFRFTFRPNSSEVYIGDPGRDLSDELDVIGSPTDAIVENFGWPCYEGPPRSPDFSPLGLDLCESLYAAEGTAGAATAPIFSYLRSDSIVAGDGCPTGAAAISGLAFYGDGTYPPGYQGVLFITDWTRECIWLMRPGPDGQPSPQTVELFAGALGSGYVDLVIGPGGDLYGVDLLGGTINRIFYNVSPVASIAATPDFGDRGITVQFDGRGSSDGNPQDVLSYAWDLDGDGAYDDSTSPTPGWSYTSVGDVLVRLRVTDDHGASATAERTIFVGTLPDPDVSSPAAKRRWRIGERVRFEGGAVDPQQGELPAASLSWTVVLHHCTPTCKEQVLTEIDGARSGTITVPNHAYPSRLELWLTARDADGHTQTTTRYLYPRTANLRLRSIPAGVPLIVARTAMPAPLVRRSIVGERFRVKAAATHEVDGVIWTFHRWSNGRRRSHRVVMPLRRQTHRAIYREAEEPRVRLTKPERRAEVTGRVRLRARAEDNDKVAFVRFFVDGRPVGRVDRRAPYAVWWNAGRAESGRHSIRAIARDRSGNTRRSRAVRVMVDSVGSP